MYKKIFILVFIVLTAASLTGQTIYRESFDNNLDGVNSVWKNQNGEIKWVNNTQLRNFNELQNGSQYKYGGLSTKNYIAFSPAISGKMDSVSLQSPIINLMMKANVKLEFFYMLNSLNSSLEVYISKDGGVVWDPLTKLGKVEHWTKFEYDLPNEYYSPGFSIKFVGISDDINCIIALDQFLLYSPYGINGTYTIGSSGNYTTFSSAINDLNNSVITGATTFNVAADFTSTEENIPAITTGGSSVNPVIFQKSGAGGNPKLLSAGTGTSNYGFCLNGVAYITFDGIDVGIASGSSLLYGYYIKNKDATTGSNNNLIKNCTITLNRSNTSSIGIYQYATGVSSAAGTNSDNKYQSFTIKNSYNGIVLQGSSDSYKDGGNYIGVVSTGFNTIGDATSNDIGNGTSEANGIKLDYQKDFKVYNSEVRNVTVAASSTNNAFGINITNASGVNQIYNNKVHNISTLTTNTSSKVFGIRADALSDGKNTIYNNIVYGLSHSISSSSATLVGFGIAGNYVNTSGVDSLYNNSVRMDMSANASNTAFYISGGANGEYCTTVNNIFANYSTTDATSMRYCYYVNAGNVGNSSNNILYIAAGTNNNVGYYNANRADFYLFASSFSPTAPSNGFEGGSSSADPNFTSSSDLTFAGSTPAKFSGTTIQTVTTDITGASRDASGPTIGAYETSQTQNDKSAPVLYNCVIVDNTNSPSVSISLKDNSNSTSNATVRLWYRVKNSSAEFTGLDADSKPSGAMNGTYTWNTSFTSLSNGNYEFYIAARDGQGAGIGIWANPIWKTNFVTLFSASDPPSFSNKDYANVRYFTKLKTLTAGDYLVGTSRTYKSLTEVATELGTCEISGNIRFLLADDYISSAETFPIVFTKFFTIGGNHSVTITVNTGAGARTTTNSTTSNLIVMDGINNLILDGRENASGTNILWTIENTANQTDASAIKLINDALNSTIRYCNLSVNNNVTTGGVVVLGTTTSTTGNDFNSITNCNLNGNGVCANGILGLGTSGKENSNLNVSDNNIYDCFNASVNSVGVNIGINNIGWNVSNNKIYQTAARTFTGSDLYYSGVHINYANNYGTSINNNTIGFANSSGTGTTQISGNDNQIYGIYAYSNNSSISSISNNIISGFVQTSSKGVLTEGGGVFYGVYISSGYVRVDSNRIGSMDNSSSIVVNSSSTTSNINPVQGICGHSDYGTSILVRNNQIGNITVNGVSGGTTLGFLGIDVNSQGTNNRVEYNTIGSSTSPITVNTSSSKLTGISLADGVNTANSNTIRNLIHTGASTGTGPDACLIGILLRSSGSNQVIDSNIIHTLKNTAVTTSAIEIAGIYCSGTGTGRIYNNFIHSLSTASTSTSTKHYGFGMEAATHRVYNNMIRMGIKDDGTAITDAIIIYGIYQSGGDFRGFYNNVYIGGSGVGTGAANSYAYYRSAAGIDSIMNNVFYNARTNSTTGGIHYTYSLNNSTIAASDYNVYYNSTGTATFSLSGGSPTNLKALRDAIGNNQDLHSGVGDPNFVTPSGSNSTINLHVQSSTPVNATAKPIGGIAFDFDGNARDATTPDIGADEGSFTGVDIFTPFISYTPLTSPGPTGSNRILSNVHITDVGGINNTDDIKKPRIWYKKYWAGTWVNSIGTLSSGTTNDGMWSFTIDYSLVSGVVENDSIYYYVIAEDVGDNIWYETYDSIVTHTNTATLTTGPQYRSATRPNNYSIMGAISGEILVGTGQTYTSLTNDNASGLFKAINNKVVSGDLSIKITSDLKESGAIALNQWAEDGTGGYKMTIASYDASQKIIYDTADAPGVSMIKFNGSDRITIDGTSGKLLLFRNTNATPANTGATFEFDNSDSSVVIRNCIIENNSTATNIGAVYFNSTGMNKYVTISNCNLRDATGGTTGSPFNAFFMNNANNKLIYLDSNNIFNWTNYGLNINDCGDSIFIRNNSFYNTGTPSTQQTSIFINAGNSHNILNNFIGGQSASCGGSAWTNSGNIIFKGIDLSVGTNYPANIQNNTIQNITLSGTNSGVNFFGISLNSGRADIGTTTGNTIGHNSTSNSISVSGGAATYGIYSNSSSTLTISNNTVANISAINTGTGVKINGITHSGTGFGTISSNTIHHLSSSSANTNTTDCDFAALGLYYNGASSSGNIISNTIYNINGTNSGDVETNIGGIAVTNVTSPVINKNRIYDIINASSSTSLYPTASGIALYNPTTSATVKNNQITIGETNSTQEYIGIWVSYTGTYSANIYYNSVLIKGTNSLSARPVYGILRGLKDGTSVTNPVSIGNNLLFISRTGGSANYAIGNPGGRVANWNYSNYNLFITPSSTIGNWSGGQTFAQWMKLSGDSRSWDTLSAAVSPTDLFTDITNGNLGINSSNSAAWYIHGKGIAVSGYSDDFGSGTRSTARIDGATDIGSVELSTPSATPENANINGQTSSFSAGGYTYFTFAGRKVAAIKWVSTTGSFPTSVTCKYYSGEIPPDNDPTKDYSDAYLDITASGGSGYKYDITLFLDPAVYLKISTDDQTRVCKNSGTGWAAYLNQGTGDDMYELNVNDTLIIHGSTSFSTFALTSSNNPLPVMLEAFTNSVNGRDVKLAWTTSFEVNNNGFNVERKLITEKEWTNISFVKGIGNSNSHNTYTYDDRKLNSGKYNYRLKQVDNNGNFKYYTLSNEVEIGIPKKYNISQNYPNPFNPVTKIDYDIPFDGKASIKIYDMTGKEIKTVLNNNVSAGYYTITLDFSGLSSGVYFYRIIAESQNETFTMTKKLVLIK